MESTGQGCLRRHPRAPEDGAAAVQGLERAGHRAARVAGEETGARGSGAAMGADSNRNGEQSLLDAAVGRVRVRSSQLSLSTLKARLIPP